MGLITTGSASTRRRWRGLCRFVGAIRPWGFDDRSILSGHLPKRLFQGNFWDGKQGPENDTVSKLAAMQEPEREKVAVE
jgi:hypothetical protein